MQARVWWFIAFFSSAVSDYVETLCRLPPALTCCSQLLRGLDWQVEGQKCVAVIYNYFFQREPTELLAVMIVTYAAM